jgi:DNA topoisomerase IA
LGQRLGRQRIRATITSRLKEHSLVTQNGRKPVLYTTMSISANCVRHVLRAAMHPVDLDERQVNAVAARIELDLRLGAAFTRYQTMQLQCMADSLANRVISYGYNTVPVFRTLP